MSHGYYEVYVPVWDPEIESQLVNLTLDITADEEALNDIHSKLHSRIAEYSDSGLQEMQDIEKLLGDNLTALLDAGLIQEAYCDRFAISSPEDLQEALDSDEIEVFPI